MTTNPRRLTLLTLILVLLSAPCVVLTNLFSQSSATAQGVNTNMDNSTVVLIGVLFILTVLVIAAFAVIVNFGNRAFNALPEWAERLIREQAPATLTALEGRVDSLVIATPTKVDDELWAELKPRIRALLMEIIKDDPAEAAKLLQRVPTVQPVDMPEAG